MDKIFRDQCLHRILFINIEIRSLKIEKYMHFCLVIVETGLPEKVHKGKQNKKNADHTLQP